MFVIRSRPFPLLAFLVIAQTLQAQITSATLSGTATDATGALVPNAHVEARNLNTGLVRTADPTRTEDTCCRTCLLVTMKFTLR